MRKILTIIALATAWCAIPLARAGTATYNFDTDPATILNITGNNPQPWRSSGGKTGGFLAITYPEGSQNTTVVFPDIDAGKVVTAFTFECDLRVGNPRANVRPADGFSISFGRAGDPVIDTGSGFAGGVPEAGTTTGIAISFDTWAGNTLPDGADVEGVIVRVDNKTVLRQPMPTRNGACDDTTSLQTGPRNVDYWNNGGDPQDPASWADLCWQPFSIELDATGKLTVKYKNRTILDKFQTTYFPSPGRLVLAGRTGGADENTHFDNIKLTTQSISDAQPPTAPTNLQGTAVHARRVKLTWGPGTDDSGKIAYEVERDGTLLPAVVTDTTYAEASAPNTSHTYRVRSVDPALNKSAFIGPVTVKTPVETLTSVAGVMKWEAYTGIGGGSVDALTGDAKFPDSPDEVRIVGAFEAPSQYADNFGGRVSGFVTPTESGNYVFFMSTDDNGALYLSTDENPANKKLIASETAWSNSRQWTISGGSSDLTSKRSDQFAGTEWPTGNTITLTAGKRYYAELLYKEGGGGDVGGVTMIKAGAADPANGSATLSGNLIASMVNPDAGPPSILQQPLGTNVAIGATVTLTANAIGTKPLSYQWQRGGVNIAGATSPTLTISNAGASNFGSYSVVVSNEEGTATSQGANILVNGLPSVLFIHSTGGPNASDLAAVNRLQSQGWQVIMTGATPSQTSDATGKSLIIISSTVSSGEVGDKFKTVAVPVLNWEAALQDNFDTTDRANDADTVTRGVAGSQTQLNIVKADHPLAAGFAAGLKAYSSGADASWGVVGPGATVIATIADDPTRAALYVYEAGANLFDGTKAAAKRLQFPAGDNTFLALTADGLKLFDAAVTYLTGGAPVAKNRDYSIGINFGSDEPNAGNRASLTATEVAGVPAVAQANWNNVKGQNGTNTTVVADNKGASEATSATVVWTSNGSWSSTGRGEENNRFATNSPDFKLMTGYLDTGNATTTTVSIASIPAKLVSGGYDVYVYAMGGVGGRGGSYRILDAGNGKVLRDYVRAVTPTNSTSYVEVPTNLGAPDGSGNRTANQIFGLGNYIVFRGLKAPSITVQAVTAAASTGLATASTPRAPINAIQLVAPTTGSDIQDVTQPGDTIASLNASTRSPAAEQVVNAIDNSSGTKYLNFGTDTDTAAPFVGPVGFTVTPSAGASVVTGLSFTSANDAPERDPASYKLEGSNDGTTYALISEGTIAKFSGRFIRQEVTFKNTTAYSSYRLTIPTVANGTTANSMQVAEVELLGKVTGPPPGGKISISASGGKIVITYQGTLQSADSITGPFSAVAGAVSPFTVTPTGSAKFYIAR